MAGVSLKKDFKDGDKLFAQQLNNNFGAIQAALEAMNKIVWQDDPDDMVVTFRGTTEEINNREVIDGQLLYDTTTGETYIDYGSQRISTGSGNAIFIGDTEPSNPSTQLWINPDEPMQVIGSEVVNSLEGDETNKAPSVDALKKGIIDSGSNANGTYIKFYDGTMICHGVHNLGAITTAGNTDGSLYYYDMTLTRSYAQEFISKPHLILNTFTNSNQDLHYIWDVQKYNTAGNSGFSNYRIYSPINTTLNVSTEYIAIGRWK